MRSGGGESQRPLPQEEDESLCTRTGLPSLANLTNTFSCLSPPYRVSVCLPSFLFFFLLFLLGFFFLSVIVVVKSVTVEWNNHFSLLNMAFKHEIHPFCLYIAWGI